MANAAPYLRYLAFLRGMNVGGHRVRMAELRTYFETLGFGHVETFIASGNVIFTTPTPESESQLQQRIEVQLMASLGYAVRTFLRTPAEIAEIVANSPFDIAATKSAGHTIHVGFLDAPLDASTVRFLEDHHTSMDVLAVRGRELFWLCRGKTTDSLVSWPTIEKVAKWNITMRNMNSVVKLAAKYSSDARRAP